MVDTGELAIRLAALETRVRELEDHEAVAQLIASYGPAVDSGSADATANLWEADGVFDVGGHFTMDGHAEIAAMVTGAGHQSLIQHGCGHVLTAPKIRLAGDEATAWNYAFNIRWDAPNERFWIARLSANEWRCRRGPDGWRVAHRNNVNLDGDELPRELLRHSTVGGA